MQYPNFTWQGSIQPQIIAVLFLISSTPDSNPCQSTQLWSLGRKAPCGLLPHDPKALVFASRLKAWPKVTFTCCLSSDRANPWDSAGTHFFLSTAPSRRCVQHCCWIMNEWSSEWKTNEWTMRMDTNTLSKWERNNSIHSLSRKWWRKTKGSFWKIFLFLGVGRYACG